MIIGQVNRQVAYGGLFKNLFKKERRKDTQILGQAINVILEENAVFRLKNAGKDATAAEQALARERQKLREIAGKDAKKVRSFLA
ncbi:MAG: hypothetical protein GX568_00410 [Candidatus Gastranaerophilales bacterium]|nr:hypothetical protein [Candidatus Gastranaerophilales bacterium]